MRLLHELFYRVPEELSRHILSWLNPLAEPPPIKKRHHLRKVLSWCKLCGERLNTQVEWSLVVMGTTCYVYYECENCNRQVTEDKLLE